MDLAINHLDLKLRLCSYIKMEVVTDSIDQSINQPPPASVDVGVGVDVDAEFWLGAATVELLATVEVALSCGNTYKAIMLPMFVIS